VEVIIAGKGPLQAKLAKMIDEYELGNHVRLAGFVSEEDKPALLASANVCVFPSTGGEAFGIVLAEAMAAGALVLAGDNPGYRSVMSGGGEAALFDPRDKRQFAAKINHVLKNATQFRQLHQWQAHSVNAYDIEKIGAIVEDLYYRVQRKA
jgi:phosphatidylinositol alpha-mannosyltransferase